MAALIRLGCFIVRPHLCCDRGPMVPSCRYWAHRLRSNSTSGEARPPGCGAEHRTAIVHDDGETSTGDIYADPVSSLLRNNPDARVSRPIALSLPDRGQARRLDGVDRGKTVRFVIVFLDTLCCHPPQWVIQRPAPEI